ncbi:hypothetical protein QN372_11135 [Undibacterium sp. RTI2.1]|uniref:hypothetical protein n=1 Tax=unclassified Undibacterium TaxID=2630295 RepID=UPI002B23CB55|nr:MULTISPECIES: hypothetical protein [unclassified Undibacterium]MEB0031304.1 hypothetical protein [Undibacterium sp. RTI2.1]MEB0117673.1 hypothetical protein [Undibacterium sp. RTI2.2]
MTTKFRTILSNATSVLLSLCLATSTINSAIAQTTSSGAVGKGIIHINDVGAETVTYVHTDGLGSLVARTDQNGTRLTQTKYEAYGMTVAGGDIPTIGFTIIGFCPRQWFDTDGGSNY